MQATWHTPHLPTHLTRMRAQKVGIAQAIQGLFIVASAVPGTHVPVAGPHGAAWLDHFLVGGHGLYTRFSAPHVPPEISPLAHVWS